MPRLAVTLAIGALAVLALCALAVWCFHRALDDDEADKYEEDRDAL